MDSPPLNVLIIEDDPDYRLLLCRQLQRCAPQRLSLTECGRLDAALPLIEASAPDIILLDLSLPDSRGVSGIELLRHRAPAVPVVVLTADSNEQVGDECLRHGAQETLIKGDFEGQLLLRVLRYAVQTKRAERALEAMRARLIEAAKYESVARLARGIAHEVLNPLNIVRLGVGALGGELALNPEDRREVAEQVDEAIVRAETLIRGLSGLSSPETDGMRPVSAGALLRQAACFLSNPCKKRDIDLALEPEPGGELIAEESLLHEALIQIGLNAIAAMEPGGTLRLAARRLARSGGDAVELRVEDSGPGMDPERLPLLMSGAEKGGLGIAVARAIAEMHGGELVAANRPEGGLRVSLILPLKPLS